MSEWYIHTATRRVWHSQIFHLSWKVLKLISKSLKKTMIKISFNNNNNNHRSNSCLYNLNICYNRDKNRINRLLSINKNHNSLNNITDPKFKMMIIIILIKYRIIVTHKCLSTMIIIFSLFHNYNNQNKKLKKKKRIQIVIYLKNNNNNNNNNMNLCLVQLAE